MSQAAINLILARRTVRNGAAGSKNITAALAANSSDAECLIEGDSDENTIDDDDACSRCHRKDRVERRLLQHTKNNKEDKIRTPKDVTGPYITRAYELLKNKEVHVISARDDAVLSEFGVSNAGLEPMPKGWARKDAKLQCANIYIERHADLIQLYFDRGTRDKAHNMSASAMRKKLIQTILDHFDIPYESDIEKYIQVIFSRQKMRTSAAVGLRHGMIHVYRDETDRIVSKSMFTITAANTVTAFKRQFMFEG